MALKCERLIKTHGFAVTPRATPRALSNECGICLLVVADDPEAIAGPARAAGVEIVRHFTFRAESDQP